jgi:RNA binding exosome subunit
LKNRRDFLVNLIAEKKYQISVMTQETEEGESILEQIKKILPPEEFHKYDFLLNPMSIRENNFEKS